MNHINILDKIKEDLEENIASKCESMVPDNELNDAHYVVKKSSFGVYIGSLMATTGNDPLIQTTPSLTLSIKNGKRNVKESEFVLRINIIIWNPGTYKSQNYFVYDNENALGGKSFKMEEIVEEAFERNANGYIELWNMIDKIVDYIAKYDFLAGYKTDRENIKYDQERDEEGYPLDFYPYWNGWIEVPIVKKDKYIEDDIKDYL